MNERAKPGDSRDYFEAIAPEWDAVRKTLFRDEVRAKALAAAGIAPGQSSGKVAARKAAAEKAAADIGAGSGFLTEALLAAGLRVIAIDRAEAMLAAMRAKFPAAGERLELRLGESEALPLPGESVDYAFANMFVHHVERPAAAVAEMARVLKPGGRLVITDMNYHGLEWVLEQYHDRWPGFRQEEVRGWLEAAGLKMIAVRDLNERCDACSEETGETFPVTMFVATGEKG